MDPLPNQFLNFDNPFDQSFESLPCVQNIYLQDVDIWIFRIGGSLVLLATSFLLIGALRFKELRRQPGDLIVGIALSDFILSIHWLILSSFPSSVQYPSFCTPVGALGTFGGICEFLYNSSFSIFLIVSLRNALKQAKIPKKSFHIVNMIIAFVYLLDLLIKQEIGRTLAGTCSIRSKCGLSYYNYVAPFIALVYAILGGFTYYYVKKNTPKCAKAHTKRTQFLLYYLRYNVAATIIYFCIALTNVIDSVVFDPSEYDSTNPNPNAQKSNWVNSLYNFAKLCSPLVLSIIRYNDPTIKSFMWRTIVFWKKVEVNPANEPLIRNGEQVIPNVASIAGDDKEFIFNELSADLKTVLTYTLLSCVLYANNLPKLNMRESMTPQTADKKSKNPYKHEKVFLVEHNSILGDLPTLKQEIESQQQEILSGTLKIYSPEIFAKFIRQDEDFINISDSLDFIHNRKTFEKIRQTTKNAGGRSGEFFFFSEDKKLILKTVPDVELKMLISILERYDQHHEQNENSLIAKIYGAYTYENTDLGYKFNLILMKNICGFPSEFVRRTYDMKGSKFEREELKQDDIISDEFLKSKVMKDVDFEKLEKNLNIKVGKREQFLRQITADSLFFRSVKLIDYSFMVFIVDKHEAYKHMDKRKDFTADHPLQSIESESEPGVYYNMGIIDYLQPYNFQKAFEKFIKRLKKLDPNLDTSTQDPEYYSSRFIAFIKKLVTQETNNESPN